MSANSLEILSIIRQVIDNDCHLGQSDRLVIRHVISKLRNGYKSFRAMPKAARRSFINQCVTHHRANHCGYIEIMKSFRLTE